MGEGRESSPRRPEGDGGRWEGSRRPTQQGGTFGKCSGGASEFSPAPGERSALRRERAGVLRELAGGHSVRSGRAQELCAAFAESPEVPPEAAPARRAGSCGRPGPAPSRPELRRGPRERSRGRREHSVAAGELSRPAWERSRARGTNFRVARKLSGRAREHPLRPGSSPGGAGSFPRASRRISGPFSSVAAGLHLFTRERKESPPCSTGERT